MTWLSTEPKVYLQLGVVVASSIASDIAVPNVPGWRGSRVIISLPARVDIDGEPVTSAPKVRIILLR